MPPTATDSRPSSAHLKMRERLIVALDVSTGHAAREIFQRIGDAAGIYKIGLQLFSAEGPQIVRDMVGSGRRVFLDLKLHDIPNTVGHAIKAAAELGPSMITVHASGGPAMLRAAVEAAGSRMSVLAVTVLTSFRDAAVREPDAKSVGKKGRNCTPDGSGWSKARRWTTSARPPSSQASR